MKNKYDNSSSSEQSRSSLRRKIWNGEEDAFLDSCVKDQTQKSEKKGGQSRINWKAISNQFINLNSEGKLPFPRSGKQCRERWRNHLIIPVPLEWNNEDRLKLFEYNTLYCNKWAKICKLMGRTENDVKNQYHVSYRKRLNEVLKELNSEKIFSKVYRQATIQKTRYNQLTIEHITKLVEEVTHSLVLDYEGEDKEADSIESKQSCLPLPEKKGSSLNKKSCLDNKIIILQHFDDKVGEPINKQQKLRLKYSNQDDESNSEQVDNFYYITKFENFCNQPNREGKINFSDF